MPVPPIQLPKHFFSQKIPRIPDKDPFRFSGCFGHDPAVADAAGGKKHIRKSVRPSTHAVRLKPEKHPLRSSPAKHARCVLVYGFSQTLSAVEAMKYVPSRFSVRVRKSRYFINTAAAGKDRQAGEAVPVNVLNQPVKGFQVVDAKVKPEDVQQGTSVFWGPACLPVVPKPFSLGIVHDGIDKFIRKSIYRYQHSFVHHTRFLEVLCCNLILSEGGCFFRSIILLT
jgi:hypothetical protein